MTLTEMLTTARYYLDEDTETFWTDTELTSYINTAYEHYYLQAVDNNYPGLLTSPSLLSIVSGTETVALPSDFYKAKTLERVFDTWNRALEYKDRLGGSNLTSGTSSSFYLPNWSIRGTNIVLEPTPAASFTNGLKLVYWPIITEMSSGSDTPADGFRSSWHKMIPLKAAQFAKGGREESDTTLLERLLAPLEMNFISSLESVTAARKETVPFIT